MESDEMMVVCSLYVFISFSLGAGIYDQSFREGNDAYYKKDFYTAILKYEKLVESGVEDPVLFYNLANSYYHWGKKGMAIANYERALELNPSFKMAKEQLSKVLNETKRNLAVPEEPMWWKYLFIWHYGISQKWTWRIALFLWVLGWIILGFILWQDKSLRKTLFIGGSLILTVGIIFFMSGVIKILSPPLGVIIVTECSVHITPSDNSPPRFNLYEGDRVQVEREDGEWMLIRTVDNERGWIKDKDIFIWRAPYRTVSQEYLNEKKEMS
ncbi:MAG TPA: hypothetical protein PLJ10_00180 [Candidatus Hydrogenedens sp.]|nr:hypothetical protein [Candidatus Hydrogenedens sp.]